MSNLRALMVTPGMSHEDLVAVVGWLVATMNGDRDGQASPANWVGYGGDAYTLTIRNDDPDARSALWLDQDGTTVQLRANTFGLYSDKALQIGAILATTLTVTGNAAFGTNNANLFVVNSTATFASPATFNGTTAFNQSAAFNGSVSLGDAPGDAIVVNGTATFEESATFNDPVAFEDNVTFNAAVTFNGGLNVDDLDVTGNLTVGGSDLFVDAANGRVIVGSTTALSSATNDRFTVKDGTAYFAGPSGPAIGIRYNGSQSVGWTLGVDGAGANKDLLFLDDGAAEILRVGDASSTYQVRVSGDANVTDDLVVGGDLVVTGNASFDGAAVTFTGDVTMDGDLTGDGGVFNWQDSGNSRLKMDATGLSFFAGTTVTQPVVVGTLTGATLPQLTAVVSSMLDALSGAAGGVNLVNDLTV